MRTSFKRLSELGYLWSLGGKDADASFGTRT